MNSQNLNKIASTDPSWLNRDFLALLENTSDFIYIKDTYHRFTSTSSAFARLTGHDDWRDLIGKTDFDIFPEEHAKRYFEFERPVMVEGQPLIDHEEPYYDEQGNLRWVTSSKHPVRTPRGEIIGLVGISKDITAIKSYQAIIREMANYDELTGLANRRLFSEVFHSVLARTKRTKEQLALLYIDLDNFKCINDSKGHAVGDKILKQIADCLKQKARECDLLARVGGDEFVLVLSSAQHIEDSAIQIGQRVIESIQTSFKQDALACKLGCSIGVACYPRDGNNLDELLEQADGAMYRAKALGKNNIKFCE